MSRRVQRVIEQEEEKKGSSSQPRAASGGRTATVIRTIPPAQRRLTNIITGQAGAQSNIGAQLHFRATGNGEPQAQRAGRYVIKVKRGQHNEDGKPIVGGQHERFFHVELKVLQGMRLSSAIDKVVDAIKKGGKGKSGSGGFDEANDDEGDFDILNIREMASMQDFRENEDLFDDEDELGANHQFQPVRMEASYSIKQLVLRDFPCIFESLAIIQAHREGNQSEALTFSADKWSIHVRLLFNSLSQEERQLFFEQKLVDCVKWFNEKYYTCVYIFDAHKAEHAEEKLKAFEELNGTVRYLLIYWGEHVFPALREKLPKICEEIKGDWKKLLGETAKMFCMFPRILKRLSFEEHYKRQGAALPPISLLYREGEDPQADGFNIFDILATDPMANMNVLDKQQTFLNNRLMMRDEAERMSLEDVGAYLSPYQLSKDPHASYLRHFSGPRNSFINSSDMETYLAFKEDIENAVLAMGHTMETVPEAVLEHKESEFTEYEIWSEVVKRRNYYDGLGRGFFDIETCVNNSVQSGSYYNMVPFLACFTGDMQYHYSEYVNGQRIQKVGLKKGIRKHFTGTSPGEVMRKFVQYLHTENFVQSDKDYKCLSYVGRDDPRRVTNYIFAHNGFGFDFRFLQDALHSYFREFTIIGDCNNIKCIKGNGLIFYDFALIYRDTLKNLAITFFPGNKDFHKLDSALVIDLPYEDVLAWNAEMGDADLSLDQHPRMKPIVEYCYRDCEVLGQIVNKFFRDVYTKPFGHAFLPQPFFHSLSSLAYQMFNHCYLKKPIFVSERTLAIEKATKMGGFTDGNCCSFQAGVFLDVTSFYPSVMMNDMPVEYTQEDLNSPDFVVHFTEPGILRCLEDAKLLGVENISIYRVAYKFPEGTVSPMVTQRCDDTLVALLETEGYDSILSEETLHDKGIWLFGYTILCSLKEIAGAEFKVFSVLPFKAGDKIFKSFITDQYQARKICKQKGDKVGDLFHKNLMNSAQGKLGQRDYENVLFGGPQFIRDQFYSLCEQSKLNNKIRDVSVKKILSDQMDLYEMKWSMVDDEFMQTGNTVRIPSYIMAVSRTHLLHMQNIVAKALKDPHCIGYYDTDSMLIKLDGVDQDLNGRVQQLYDQYLQSGDEQLVQQIGLLFENSFSMGVLNELQVPDVTEIDKGLYAPLIHPDRLGACKIEKFVIRGYILGAKQYAVHFVEKEGGVFKAKQAVKLKGVSKAYRTMDLARELFESSLAYFRGEEGARPFVLTPVMSKWLRQGGGVNVVETQKILRMTLSKRKHNFLENTSRPYLNVAECLDERRAFNERFSYERTGFKDHVRERIAQLLTSASVIKGSEALREQVHGRLDAQRFFAESLDLVRRSRQRLMMSLPQVKFEGDQDRLFRLITSNAQVRSLCADYLPRLNLLGFNMLAQRVKSGKKALNKVLVGANKAQMGRCLAFFLMSYYLLSQDENSLPSANVSLVKTLIDRQFTNVFFGIPSTERQKPPKSSAKTLSYCFDFLQAPICSLKPDAGVYPNISLVDDIPVRDAHTFSYTTLWDIYTNILESSVLQVGVDQQAQELLLEEGLQLRFDASLLSLVQHNPANELNTFGVYQITFDGKRNDNNELIQHKTLIKDDKMPSRVRVLQELQAEEEEELEREEELDAGLRRILMGGEINQVPREGALPISEELLSVPQLLEKLRLALGAPEIHYEFLFPEQRKDGGINHEELLVDMLYVWLFLFNCGVGGIRLFRSLYSMDTSKERNQAFKIAASFEILFQRPNFLSSFRSRTIANSNKTYRALIKDLLFVLVESKLEDFTAEEDFLRSLNQVFTAEKEYLKPKKKKEEASLYTLIKLIREDPKFKEAGSLMVKNVMRWADPKDEVLKTLKEMLMQTKLQEQKKKLREEVRVQLEQELEERLNLFYEEVAADDFTTLKRFRGGELGLQEELDHHYQNRNLGYYAGGAVYNEQEMADVEEAVLEYERMELLEEQHALPFAFFDLHGEDGIDDGDGEEDSIFQEQRLREEDRRAAKKRQYTAAFIEHEAEEGEEEDELNSNADLEGSFDGEVFSNLRERIIKRQRKDSAFSVTNFLK